MLVHSNRIRVKALSIFAFLFVASGLMHSSTAQAQIGFDLPKLIQKVKPSIAKIEIYNKGKRVSSGSGFLVDDKGMIATNYHVIEGAKEVRVSFPGRKDGKVYKALGFVGFVQSKDIALIMLDPKKLFNDKNDKKGNKAINHQGKEKGDGEKKKKLRPLPMADKCPLQGETIIAYGAPLGISDTVTTGVVSAIRHGKEVRKMLLDMYGGKFDLYGKGLGYDDEATWIHMTAPISPGNSGGPLINTKGEVVGLNTWHLPRGQNMNFAISIEHVKKFIERAGTNIQPFVNLPPPREKHGAEGARGDPKKTLELWKGVNRALNELDKNVEICERQFRKVPPVDPRNPMKGKNIRNRIISRNVKRMGAAYSEYASKISGFDNKEVDPELIILVVKDTVIAQKISDSCSEIANSSRVDSLNWEEALARLKRRTSDNDTERELLRVNFGVRYDMSFPTQAETAEEDKKLAREKKTTKSSSNKIDRSEVRTWTDKTGKFQIRAKCIGVEDGIVNLEKPNGTVLRVPREMLSKADKRFLASSE